MKCTIMKNYQADKKISIAIMSSFVVLTVQYLVLVLFDLTGTNAGNIIQFTSKIMVGLFYLIALPSVLRRNKISFIFIYLMAIFIFIFNYVVFKENWIHLKALIFPLFFTGLPSFIYAYCIIDWDILMDVMRKSSKIILVVGLIIGGLVFTGNSSVGTYSMSLSYYMLLPTIMYTNDFIENKSIKNIVILFLALIVILALGSRGAIMCLGIFTLLKIAKSIRYITLTKAMLYVVSLLILAVGIKNYKVLLEYFYNILLGYGIKSRTLRLFINDLTYSSGRTSIYKEILYEIFKRPFLGFGLAGDRKILSGRNAYVHNITIEILGNFGIIIGSIINFILACLIVMSLQTRDKRIYTMNNIWLSVGFVHLIISGSYLIDMKFWIFLGLLFKQFTMNRSWNYFEKNN